MNVFKNFYRRGHRLFLLLYFYDNGVFAQNSFSKKDLKKEVRKRDFTSFFVFMVFKKRHVK